MSKSIGVMTAERVESALVIEHAISGEMRAFPEEAHVVDALIGMPAEAIAEIISDEVVSIIREEETRDPETKVAAIGIAVAGIVRSGVIEDSPNLPQLKGSRLIELVTRALATHAVSLPVTLWNDADAVAAGIAATRGHLSRIVRVWTLGNGIGYGRYPFSDGVWEGGHTVVTLDPKETYCGCGGRGHLEGVMGNRAMRLRFMDMEPEEVFAAARLGDARCAEFNVLWHRALAAATSNSIHLAGPGRCYYTGMNARFLDLHLLQAFVQDMVKMSPLQNYSLEIIPDSDELAVIGAAVGAEQALAG